jgi:hypothetical protein
MVPGRLSPVYPNIRRDRFVSSAGKKSSRPPGFVVAWWSVGMIKLRLVRKE